MDTKNWFALDKDASLRPSVAQRLGNFVKSLLKWARCSSKIVKLIMRSVPDQINIKTDTVTTPGGF